MSRCFDRLPSFLIALLLLSPGAAFAQFSFDLGGLGGDSSFNGGLDEEDPVELTAEVIPSADPGRATLTLTATIKPDWHVYSLTQPAGGPQPTKITLNPSNRFTAKAPFTASPAPESHIDQVAWPGVEIQEHADRVVWSAPITLAEGVTADAVRVEGIVRLQACKDVCLPLELNFIANPDAPASTVVTSSVDTGTASNITPATDPAPLAAGGYQLDKIRFGAENTLGHTLLLAALGGLALNLMPCVLPVIGLKVMSFVSQAGKSRFQAFALNMWYSLGILAVFWVLAGLAVGFGYSWGDQAGSPVFNIVMATLVMAMGLSLLGVWEIPIPGFLGSNTTQMAASKEGALGACLKGTITTLLAIPCTGPGMATALGWSVGKPPSAIVMVFTAIGLGMASPYIIIGAFPGLVKFLPKPGAWMETFKQLMGFVLIGTVVFLLSQLPPEYVVPSLALLTAVGLACWVYAGVPLTATSADKWQSYALCGAILMGGGVLSFGWLLPDVAMPRLAQRIESAADEKLNAALAAAPKGATVASLLAAAGASADPEADWQPFTLRGLNELAVESGRPVLVDFSAEWCLTCKTLEKTVLHTDEVKTALEQAGVATMYADYTEYPPEIKATLAALRSQSVPVIALFPADDPYRPIVFRGGYTQGQLLDAIQQAAGQPVAKLAAN